MPIDRPATRCDPAGAADRVARLFWSRRVRVFDLDGTLVHTLPDLAGALNRALRELGFHAVPTSLVRASLHGGLEGSVAAAAAWLRVPTQVQAPLLARYRRHYAAGLALRSVPYDGVVELLAHLSARGEPLAVCTNKATREAEALLDALGLLEHFALVVGADTCGERKPHPKPLHHTLLHLGARVDEVVFVGDSAVDADCAAAAGVQHLWFSKGYGVAPAQSPWRLDSFRLLLDKADARPV
jgi:2-phosphoglycolate phosphatase